MSENEKLRALLAEAREWVELNGEAGCPADQCEQCAMADEMLQRIDAALAEPVAAGIGWDPPDRACVDCGHCMAGFMLTWKDGEGAKEFCVHCRGNTVTDIGDAVSQLVRQRDEARAEVERLNAALTAGESAFGLGFDAGFRRGREAMREAVIQGTLVCDVRTPDESERKP